MFVRINVPAKPKNNLHRFHDYLRILDSNKHTRGKGAGKVKFNIALLVLLSGSSIAQADNDVFDHQSGVLQIRYQAKPGELKARSMHDTGKDKGILKNNAVCTGGSFRVLNRGKELYNIKSSVFLLNGYKKIIGKRKLFTREDDPRSRAPALLHIQPGQEITLYLMRNCIARNTPADRKPVYIQLMDVPHFWKVSSR